MPRPTLTTTTTTLSLLTRTIRQSSTSTSASTKSLTPRQPIYFGPNVYWGKAWKNVYGTGLLYVPVVAAVMFWPVPIAPMMNFSKGVKKEGVVA
ncbi:hypothetical protein BELL_0763g00030 [Botrytis elliptica]|uniref:Uncharacterized protein n=1 Tax=Botrytis elliptica TaxID=278938 RepID=A0A4Z1J7D7_9HELO|nr:hypothetical protein EAE99_007250 [Botrytis elliptica]TGO69629.1 hypothetical protein BELL_0763g00030 [Botrytis elliptica]